MMLSRNLTEIFNIMRNNASKHRILYSVRTQARDDADFLLKRMYIGNEEEGLGIRDDCDLPPSWLDKLEEAQYTLSKIKPKLDELLSLHTRQLLRPNFDENIDDGEEMKKLSQEISKLITSTHRHIQCIRSSTDVGSKQEQSLTANVLMYLMITLQDLTIKFRNCQNTYLKQTNLREERSQKIFDAFKNSQQNTESSIGSQASSKPNNKFSFCNEDVDETNLDEYFQRPTSERMTEYQVQLFKEESTRLIQSRDEKVTKIVQSIYELNDIFKDLSQLVLEQGTILDRIDYTIEQTETKVSEGLRQLHRAEVYQKKNHKMCVVVLLASTTLFMLLLLIFIKI